MGIGRLLVSRYGFKYKATGLYRPISDPLLPASADPGAVEVIVRYALCPLPKRLKRTIFFVSLLREFVDSTLVPNTASINNISAVTDRPGEIQVLFGH